jgi:tetratricopeptide (TPR) repeat protein
MRFALALPLALVVGCGWGGRLDRLQLADHWLASGRAYDARNEYSYLLWSKDPATRVRALLGASHASAKLHDPRSAIELLRRAAEANEAPGVSEDAWFEWAEHLRAEGDHARALSFYYRAAAGCASHRAKGPPYDRAIAAIASLHGAP